MSPQSQKLSSGPHFVLPSSRKTSAPCLGAEKKSGTPVMTMTHAGASVGASGTYVPWRVAILAGACAATCAFLSTQELKQRRDNGKVFPSEGERHHRVH